MPLRLQFAVQQCLANRQPEWLRQRAMLGMAVITTVIMITTITITALFTQIGR